MARFSRVEVILAMKQTGIVPVFYHPDPALCYDVVKACFDGGIRVFEFTNRGDFAHEVFSDLSKKAMVDFPELILGAGSVVDAPTAVLYMQMGAAFIVSPALYEDVAVVCNRRKVPWSPGCGTVTEISRAEELGAEVVKVFPAAQLGGPKFVSAVRGPRPWTSIMPTGGVEPNEDNLRAWFDAGVACVGIGSKLITKQIISNKDFKQLEETVRHAVGIVKKIKGR